MQFTFRSFVIGAVLLTFTASQASASDFLASALKAAETEAATTQRPASRGRNPYTTPAIVLMSVGGGLAMLGFLIPSGVECTSGRDFYDVSCGTKANKGLLFAGLAAAGLGGVLLVKGNAQRTPAVVVGPGQVAVRHRVSF